MPIISYDGLEIYAEEIYVIPVCDYIRNFKN